MDDAKKITIYCLLAVLLVPTGSVGLAFLALAYGMSATLITLFVVLVGVGIAAKVLKLTKNQRTTEDL